MVVAAYVEELTKKLAPASVKRHLAAIRMLFDWRWSAKFCRSTRRARCGTRNTS